MSERALRDEIEALHAAILEERAKLAVPVDAELSRARSSLQAEVETLTARLRTLVDQREALEDQTNVRRQEAMEARAELEAARAEIGSREPLGDPLQESRSNWETSRPGCAVGMLALLTGAALAAGWWL